MGQTVGEIDLGLNVNQSMFNKQINGLAKSAQTPIMNAFKPIGKMIGSVLAITAVAKFTKSCFKLGSDLTEVQNVVDTTFRTMSNNVNQFASDAMMQFGMSETVAKKYMGTLGAMSKSMGFSEQEVYDMSAAVTGLTGDVASFYNLSSDEAFDKLKSIWTGETETLKSIGVLLTQTNLDQYALNNGFGKTTAKMTEQEKVMLRYQYTMSALADASGDFAKTSGSWANQTRILSLQFDSLKATLGQGFINLFTPIIQMINSLLAKLQTLAQVFKRFTEMIAGDAGSSALGNITAGAAGATDGLNNVTDAAKAAAKATGMLSIDELNIIGESDTSSLGSSASNLGTVNTEAGKTTGILSVIDKSLDDIDIKIAGFTKGIEPFTTAIKNLWDGGLSKLANFTATGLIDFYNSFLVPMGTWAFGTEDKGLTRLINIINKDLSSVDWNTVNKNLKDFWTAIEPYAEGFGEGLIDFFEDVSDLSIGIFKALFGENGAVTGLTDFLNDNDPNKARLMGKGLAELALGFVAFKKATPVLATLVGLFSKLGALNFTSIVTGIENVMAFTNPAMWGQIGVQLEDNVFKGTIFDTNTWTGLPKILNDGVNLAIDGLGKIGISNLEQAFEDTLTLNADLFDGSAYFFNKIGEDFKKPDCWGEVGLDILNGILGALEAAMSVIGSPVILLYNWIRRGVDDAIKMFNGENNEDAKESGKNVVSGFTSGITDMATSMQPITDWQNNIVKTIHDGPLKFGSPSKTAKQFGTDTILGYNNGVRGSMATTGTIIKQWMNMYIVPYFTKERWLAFGNNIKTGFNTGLKGLVNNTSTLLNTIIGSIEMFANQSASAINKLIDGTNAITSASGGSSSLPTIGNVSLARLPMLAQGGYVGANQPTLAMIGDNKREGEIVSPESKLMDMAVRAAEMANGSNLSNELLTTMIELLAKIITLIENLHLDVELDGRSVLQQLNDAKKRLGHQF